MLSLPQNFSMYKHILLILALFAGVMACKGPSAESGAENGEETTMDTDTLLYPEEVHLKNLRQLTFGGDNAEAYWSFGDDKLVFQSNFSDWGVQCDQIFIMDLASDVVDGQKPPMVSWRTPFHPGLGL